MTLETAYHEIMERIVVTDAMRGRILQAIEEMPLAPKRTGLRPTLLRYAAAAACLAVLAAGAVVLPRMLDPGTEQPPTGVQNPLPSFTNVSSAQELAQLVGFSVEDLTVLPFSPTDTQYLAYGGELAEVRYIGSDQTMVLRKTQGESDPSGDYTSYPDTCVLPLDGAEVTLKGDGDAYVLAVWQQEGFSYSLKSSLPLSTQDWEEILLGMA